MTKAEEPVEMKDFTPLETGIWDFTPFEILGFQDSPPPYTPLSLPFTGTPNSHTISQTLPFPIIISNTILFRYYSHCQHFHINPYSNDAFSNIVHVSDILSVFFFLTIPRYIVTFMLTSHNNAEAEHHTEKSGAKVAPHQWNFLEKRVHFFKVEPFFP